MSPLSTTEQFRQLVDVSKWVAPAARLARVFGNTAPELGEEVIADATITTDKADYAPGETVVITGTGWTPGETVRLQVVHLTGGGSDGDGHDPWTVVADHRGRVKSFWYVDPDDSANVTFLLTADGLTSGLHAEATFTDASVGTYDQCSNDDGDGYATGDTGCRWINGNLNANNSTFAEDEATPQRLWLEGLAPNSLHTITLVYGTTRAGTHAYDYLTTYSESENWIALADRCQDIPGCTTAAEDTLDVPDDPNVPNTIEPTDPGDRLFTMRGGDLTAATVPAIIEGTYAGNSETAITVSFTVAGSGPMCTTNKQGDTLCSVALWFGGHIASTDDWDPELGATNIPGSPYHVSLDSLDGESIGERDNQMQSEAVVVDLCPTERQAECDAQDTVCANFTCNPVDGACVPTFAPPTQVCRTGSGDLCDPAEFCTGASAECPANTVAPATTICRPGSGDICDPAESCTGVPGAACPANVVAPATTICNPGSGDICDPAESCTGVADAACPADTIAPATTICNPGSGDICDPAESCTGVADAACPADTIAPATTVCREGSGDICDPDESCTGVADAACPADEVAPATTICREDAGICDVAESCPGAGEPCPPNETEECGGVTDSSLCFFDFGPGDTCDNDERQFNLLFTPDAQLWPAHKLNASNPGQFFYNAFVDGTAGATVPVTFTIPWPFVTQGANPVHVYDAAEVDFVDGCFLPDDALAAFPATFGLANYASGTGNSGPGFTITCDLIAPGTLPNNTGKTCEVVINVVIPASGAAYVNMHLDYGLKGKDVDANPIGGGADRYDHAAAESPIAPGTRDALQNDTLNVAIATCTPYEFSHQNGGGPFTDVVENLNYFKKIAGGFGLLSNSATGDGLAGVPVALLNSAGSIVASGATDEDGYYLVQYKHKGKSAPYTVVIGGSLYKQVELKANGWAEVSYDVATGTWFVQVK